MAKNKRTKKSGSIYQRESDGMWCASVELPSLPGKRRRKVIVRAKKVEIVEALKTARAELERTGDLPTGSLTLAAWLDIWFTKIRGPKLKVSTRPSYRGNIDRYIVPAIGRVRLDKLTPAHVRRLHDYVTAPAPAGKGLSSTTALQAHRILAKALTDAMREGHIARNVATLVDAPRKAVFHKSYLDVEQTKTFLTAAGQADTEEAVRWLTAFLTGGRPGERLGLTEEMVNYPRPGWITIAWQLQRLWFEHGCGQRAADGSWPCGRKRGGNCPERALDIPSDQEVRHLEGGLYLTRPKSKAGWRSFPMPAMLSEALSAYLESRPTGAHGLVFTRDGDRPIDPSDDARAWRDALAATGMPAVSPHSARHSTNTLLDELGIPQNVRELILGHAASGGANQVYTHVADSRVAAAIESLNAAMLPATAEARV